MLNFLKVLARNLLQGPSTDPFPYKEAPTPQRFRGRVTMDPQKCVGCAICRHVCAGRAIHIQPHEEGTGYDFAIWHNSCALCGMCRHFCPTGAITMTNDWHNAHTQEEKYSWTEHHFVPYLRCAGCDAPMRLLPPDLATRIYAHSPVDMTELMKLCPSCRQVAEAQRLENMAHELVEQTEEPLSAAADSAKTAPAPEASGTAQGPAVATSPTVPPTASSLAAVLEVPAENAPAMAHAEAPAEHVPGVEQGEAPAEHAPEMAHAEAPAEKEHAAGTADTPVEAEPAAAARIPESRPEAAQTLEPQAQAAQDDSVKTATAEADAAKKTAKGKPATAKTAGAKKGPSKKAKGSPADS